ncbi:MAG: transporter related [Frankiales bacterium]|nr:transporter related [Frankiales bacterium]
MTTSAAPRPPGSARSPIAQLDGAAVAFGSTVLWRDLTLAVAPGELIAVIGGNGAGKTTLLRVLLGQIGLLAGSVTVLGEGARRGHPGVGYIPQQRPFTSGAPLRGVDLVRLGLDGHRWGPGRRSRQLQQRVDEVIVAVEAEDFARAAIGQLSGGEQQRLRVAQALVGAPALLLADEPLLSLDVGASQRICRLLDEHRTHEDRAVIVVTHDVTPLLPYIDRVIYLANGLWAAGHPDEVLTSETLTALYGSPVDVLRVRDRIVVVGAPDDAHHPPLASGGSR